MNNTTIKEKLMRIIVWGTGHIANEYVKRKSYHLQDKIIAFVDNNKDLWGGKFKDIDIIPPKLLECLKFDRLIICAMCVDDIKEQIEKEICIDLEKVITYFELEDEIKNKIVSRYAYSQDGEIQKVLEYYKFHPLNIFGFYNGDGENIIYPVEYETDGMPYILFEEKKMFFPKKFKFEIIDNVGCVRNILYEQGKHSPHLYVESEDIIKQDMVIVDAGVCEGNFALRYIDKAKKVYLIESDPVWVEALQRTFEPYKDKVVICDKFLAGEDTDGTITLDTLINEKIDILKMDIEGYEIDALKGGRRVLHDSDAYCAICSYHRHGDEQKIKKILQQYNYNVSTSEGYMFFPYDSYFELRRGIIYGRKDVNNGG